MSLCFWHQAVQGAQHRTCRAPSSASSACVVRYIVERTYECAQARGHDSCDRAIEQIATEQQVQTEPLLDQRPALIEKNIPRGALTFSHRLCK